MLQAVSVFEAITKRNTLIILTSLVSLGLGFLLYYFIRQDTILLFEWLGIQVNAVGIPLGLREHVIINSLPSGFWSFSYAILILLLWKNEFGMHKVLWLLSIPLLLFGYELLQLFDFFPGTFDLLDLLFTLIGMLFAFLIQKQKNKIYEKQFLLQR